MLCALISYMSGGTYSLKSIPNDRFFGKLFMTILFTLSFYQKYTYIRNWSLNPSVRIIDPVSHNTYAVCIILCISSGTCSLKSTANDFICSQSFCQKSSERKSPKKYILYFVLMSGLGLEPFTLRLIISQHTTY